MGMLQCNGSVSVIRNDLQHGIWTKRTDENRVLWPAVPEPNQLGG